MMYLPCFWAEFGEIIQRTPPSKPKNVSFRSFDGVGGRRGRILRSVATVPPQKTRETAGRAGFSVPKRAGPQGERAKKEQGAVLVPLEEAPHRRKTHPQKRCTKNDPKYGSKTSIVPRFLGQTFFLAHFRSPFFFYKKQGGPKTPPDAKPAETKRFRNFRSATGPPKPQKCAKRRAAREPEANRKTPFSPVLGHERPARTTTRHFLRRLQTPIFVAFWPPRFASGSLARGLPRSHVFDCFRAPSHSNRIYIYIYAYGCVIEPYFRRLKRS